MVQVQPYVPQRKVRIVTAASLFDGHDAAINIMRRLMQKTGVEVIHLGHDRSVAEVVRCALQEDAHAIAVTSYQGGHMEYFKYMYDRLREKNAGHIKIFGGGGGVILPEEIKVLMDYGIERIYSPDDGRAMGLQGMINDLVRRCDVDLPRLVTGSPEQLFKQLQGKEATAIARSISLAENDTTAFTTLFKETPVAKYPPVLGVTGTGGAGKSSLVDELVRRFLMDFPEMHIGILSVDPSKKRSGGGLLGDRIRMNSIDTPRVYMRSLATRQSNLALSKHIGEALTVLKASGYDLIILETSGIGQSDTEILDFSGVSLYVMTPEFGAATQLEKIDMLDFADLVAINKFDKKGAADALRDVRKQYARNHGIIGATSEDLPIYGTKASQFNDAGMDNLYSAVIRSLNKKTGTTFDSKYQVAITDSNEQSIIPAARNRYLSEIAETIREGYKSLEEQALVAQRLYGLYLTILGLVDLPSEWEVHLLATGLDNDFIRSQADGQNQSLVRLLLEEFDKLKVRLHPDHWEAIRQWGTRVRDYGAPEYVYKVRGKEIKVSTQSLSLAQNQIPKVALPKFKAWGDLLRWMGRENLPGYFPYTAGIYPFKRKGEDPTRMFAGEGGPERTNKRFHYLSRNMPAKRLSTAFDSVTLYGRDPDMRPDIFGKIGNAGVSICCLDDAKKLYSGFDLTDPRTSVSMTINGPAPMLLGFFLNAAIDQNCEKYIVGEGLQQEVEERVNQIYREANTVRPSYQGELPEGHSGLGLMLLGVTGDRVLPLSVYEKIKAKTLRQVRGTVQADILKEDQAQNTCIFSTEFALRLMGDVQEYFIQQGVRNFYSVSISGYHIAEAGANPISQLAFTLANGFTYVEYYLSRGMAIDEFGPNLSFFFSNGIDPEYAVIGRVARRIWAKAMRERYGAGPRSQLLKYHIQTSGRSLHAQEIDFNDIRTTLQALYALYDNCNSLHTNAHDEAITTPTEASVRRAMAIQLIITKELGLAKNENPLQGAFIIEELTDLVEEAVLTEFDRLTDRGGTLGAMETMYQRSKIQEESMHYEMQKHSGEYPIVGVNTFLGSEGSPTNLPKEVIRAAHGEKENQIRTLKHLMERNESKASVALADLQEATTSNANSFAKLMEAAKYCSLGQMTKALFEVGGQYRRNM